MNFDVSFLLTNSFIDNYFCCDMYVISLIRVEYELKNEDKKGILNGKFRI